MKIELDDKIIKKIKKYLNVLFIPSIFLVIVFFAIVGIDRPLFMIDYNMKDWGILFIGMLFGLTSIILAQINLNYEEIKEIKELLEVKK